MSTAETLLPHIKGDFKEIAQTFYDEAGDMIPATDGRDAITAREMPDFLNAAINKITRDVQSIAHLPRKTQATIITLQLLSGVDNTEERKYIIREIEHFHRAFELGLKQRDEHKRSIANTNAKIHMLFPGYEQ